MIRVRFPTLLPKPTGVGLWIFACLLALVVATSSAWGGVDDIAKINEATVECSSTKQYEKYLTASGDLKSDYDGDKQCTYNRSGEPTSHNGRQTISKNWPADLEHVDEKHLANLGACKRAYFTIGATFKYLKELRKDYCNELQEKLAKAQNCDHGSITLACKKDWLALKETSDQFNGKVSFSKQQIKAFIADEIKGVQNVKKLYVNDLDSIIKQRQSSRSIVRKADPAATENEECGSSIGASKVLAINGGVGSCDEYLKLLIKGDTSVASALRLKPGSGKKAYRNAGELIREQEKADENLTAALGLIELFGSDLSSAQFSANTIKEQLEEAERRNSPHKIVKTDDISGAANVANNANGLFKNNGSSISPAAAAPLALAAAGASAIASRGFGSSSGAGSSPPAQAVPPTPPSIGDLGGKTSDTGGGGGVGNTDPGRPTSPDDTAKIEDPAAPMDFTTVGSSRDLATKKSDSGVKPASSGPASGGGSGSDDAFGSFVPKLDPKPVPKSTPSNPGNEVANLLGQMKNLFNFDEPMPGSNEFAGPPPLPSNSIPALPDPNAEMPGMEDPGAGGEVAEGETSTTEEGGASSEEVQANPLGKIDVTLFKRVRDYHTKSMERGLVLYNLKERVE